LGKFLPGSFKVGVRGGGFPDHQVWPLAVVRAGRNLQHPKRWLLQQGRQPLVPRTAHQ
jgi:hypothetical protein